MSQLITPKSNTGFSTIRPLTQAEISQYYDDGYVIARNFFDAEEVKLVQSVCKEDPNLGNALKTVIDHQGKSWNASVWSGLNDSLVSVMTRTARMVEAAETLVEDTCYHWHSKIVQKPPHDDSCVDWHQGYFYWYNDGCLFPDKFLTCTLAITENTKAHGCLQVIKKSHLLGRINHVEVGNTVRCDPQRMEKVLERLELVDCEMDPGDAVFFHSNTIHGSQQNKTDETRILMHCHYNAISNQPSEEYREAHPCIPLEKLPDSAIKDKLYTSGFESDIKDWDWYNDDPTKFQNP
ncbi:phytanoyl-CoA dioxygenase family protein [Leptothoe spongobia]|uniref:Phytanoyl-CoA dioxygenase family protein n=1 Tax=Leptothoe spongobia TAU-MAC 1115 TaxID=1967444 RepID=A0A947GKC9_9CYAN|nr:phytanoyl-CoA dioxygenase family protein [Leptothoe spongobia]MBT9317710.1 phytanoyl-CoA dioxygenase family protein [Leptothoe spongobia TAU-MAC 1115]